MRLLDIHKQILKRTEHLFEFIQILLTNTSKYNLEYQSEFNHLQASIKNLNDEILKVSFDSSSFLEDAYLFTVLDELSHLMKVVNDDCQRLIHFLEKKKNPDVIKPLFQIRDEVGEMTFLIAQIKAYPFSKENTTQAISTSLEEDSSYLEYKKQVRILIVDDLKEDGELLQRFLLHRGYQNVSFEVSPTKALKIIEESKIDLLLLDLLVPGMKGLEMLNKLSKKIHKQELTVLMISAQDTKENMIACIKLGVVDFLTKPFDSIMLNARVESCIQKQWFMYHAKMYQEEIEAEKRRYEKLLHSLFPLAIVKELAETNQVKPRIYKDVAVLFTDVVGFTSYCETHPLNEISKSLKVYSEICEKASINHNLLKLKTVGDCFIGVSGLFLPSENPVQDCVQCAFEIMEYCKKIEGEWRVHSGIDYGSVIGGVVGHRQYLFDIWGDVVNTSARVLSIADPNKVCLTSHAWLKVQKKYAAKPLGWHAFKGKDKDISIYEIEIDNN